MLKIDKIYICHWSKLTERKINLINHLHRLNIHDYQWVENYDKETWNIDSIKLEYPNVFEPNPKGRLLKYSEISLLLKHCWIIKDAYEHGYNDVLVLEDDVILDSEFIDKFNKFKSQLPICYDIAWVGSCCDLHAAPIVEGKNVYKVNGSRCTHAYLLSKGCINKIVEDIKFANDGADWWWNVMIDKFKLSNWWVEPSLASQNSAYNTTIQNNELKQ